MQVYIEYVIIDNLIIDYLLLKVSLKCSRVRTSFLRLSLSSVIGTAVAVIMPLFDMKFIFTVIIKILLGALMVVTSGKFDGYIQAVKTYLFFLLFTALGGGVIIALFNFADIDYERYFSLNYNSFMPIGISIFIVFILTKITSKLVTDLLKSRDIAPFVRRCEIICNNKKYKINGYIDSGNRLFDGASGLPIIVLSKRAGDELSKLNILKNYVKSLSISTVTGKSDIKIFVIDKLVIYNGVTKNIYSNVLIGKGNVNFEKEGGYDLLLSPSLF